MKTKEVKKLKKEDLNKKIQELKLELTILQGQAATGTPPKSPGQIKKIRRTLARMRTIEYQRKLSELQKKQEEEAKE